ncbi:MAG: PQQ-binding-like beta-propeller repeat protein [Phycisphaeraceae bacterium]|nr:PQQ-binding-like beta-propeller repeat protein [Phycisphaeraceae bacterium]
MERMHTFCRWVVWAWLGVAISGASAQLPRNPVYVDDAPMAEETLGRLAELVGVGNTAEAVRALQRVLEQAGDRAIAVEDDPDLFISVRERVHRLLLEQPGLLGVYRELEGPVASARLEQDPAWVERTRLLTAAGFEAALRLAQVSLEEARFEAARLMLEQLEVHPERRERRGGADAAALLAAVATYVDRPEVWARAARWHEEAGLAAGSPSAQPWPEGAQRRMLGIAQEDHQIDMNDLPGKPLTSIGVLPAPLAEPVLRGRRMQSFPSVLPVVMGDVVVVNDGSQLTAMDRFTLTVLWRSPITPQASRRVNVQRNRALAAWDEQSFLRTAAVWQGLAFAGVGGTNAEGDPVEPAVVGVDMLTGARRWRWAAESIGPEGRGSLPIVAGVEEGVLIVQLVRRLHDERIRGVQLAGLDPMTGELRWRRPLGSIGALPFPPMSERRDAPLLEHGTVVLGDGLGITASVEAATGRLRWLRRRAVGTVSGGDAWAPSAVVMPVRDGESLVVLSPDGTEVVRLGADDGRVLGRRSASALGLPRYLIGAGRWLVGIGPSRFVVVDLSGFESAEVRAGPPLQEVSPIARAIVSHGEVVLPIEGGAMTFRPEEPRRVVQRRWERSGVLVGVSGQLLVMDGSDLHSFLVWPEAEGVLRSRMDADPGDAEPAITFAELAHQAGRWNEIPGAVERAIVALDQRGGEAAALQRDRLFASVLRMVREGGAEAALGEDELEGLLGLLGRVAGRPAQRSAHLFELGSALERFGRVQEALEAYQRVLLDDAISAAIWRGGDMSVRSDLEATRRIRVMVMRGVDASELEALAEEAFTRVSGVVDGGVIEREARRFPGSRVSARAWLEASERYAAAGESALSVRALRGGLDLVEALDRWDLPEAGEFAGRLVETLLADGREGEAIALFLRLERAAPGVVLRRHGAETDLAELVARTAPLVLERQRLPRIGPRVTGDAEAFGGWSIEEGVRGDAGGRALSYVLLRREREDGPGIELAALGVGNGVEIRWTIAFAAGTEVIQADAEGICLMEPAESSQRVVRIGASDGARRWQTPVVDRVFEAMDVADAPRRATFDAPMDGRVRSDEWIVAGDDRTLVVGLRRGRLFGVDLRTGDVLWSSAGGVQRVFDLAAGSGHVVAVGEGREASLEAYDLRTGQMTFRAAGEEGSLVQGPRWVRIGPRGEVIVGTSGGVLGLSLVHGQVLWATSAEMFAGSLDAWVLGEHVYVLTSDRNLHRGEAASGGFSGSSLMLRDTLETGSRIDIRGMSGAAIVTSSRGMAAIDDDGRCIGADGLGADTEVATPAMAEGVVVMVDRFAGSDGAHRLMLLDVTGRLTAPPTRVRLGGVPERVVVLDDWVVLDAGGVVAAVPFARR